MSDAPVTKTELKHEIALLRTELKQDIAMLATKDELGEALVPLKQGLARLEQEMATLESRLARQIGEAMSHVANVVMENTRSQIAALDDKYGDVPRATETVRVDLDAHVADARVHVNPSAPRPRARRTRSR